MLLSNKVAVVYGGGGAIGGAIARAFAAEGATVHLAGRRLATVEKVAADIGAFAGAARPAEVDALDEQSVDAHLQSIIDASGRIDISFNAVGIPDSTILGVPLVDMDAEEFARPIAGYAMSYFLTARLAARRMIPNKSGVIMTVSALPGRTGTPLNGGYGPAQAAKEAMTRDLSLELAPQGIRVVGLRPHGILDTSTMQSVFSRKAKTGMTWEQFAGYLVATAHPRRGSTLDDVAGAAAFLASDLASGLTGATLNLTMGAVSD